MAEALGEKALRGIFLDVNRAKADGGAIWVQPDPRAYFRVVDGLDCVMPHVAQPVLSQLADARVRSKGAPITILELGCGYGVNGALLKHGFSFELLRVRYGSTAIQNLDPAELLTLDGHFAAAWPSRPDVRVIGLDPSRAAVTYAERCGFVDRGIVADLETEDLSDEAAALLADVDLIVSTGSFSRIRKTAFDKVTGAAARNAAPWVAAFVPRVASYQHIAKTLRRHGLITERFESATFVQRRFRDEHEMRAALHLLDAHGINPAGKESEGWLHADLFVSRPWTDIEADPIARLVSAGGSARGDGPKVAPRPRFPALRTSLPPAPHAPQ